MAVVSEKDFTIPDDGPIGPPGPRIGFPFGPSWSRTGSRAGFCLSMAALMASLMAWPASRRASGESAAFIFSRAATTAGSSLDAWRADLSCSRCSGLSDLKRSRMPLARSRDCFTFSSVGARPGSAERRAASIALSNCWSMASRASLSERTVGSSWALSRAAARRLASSGGRPGVDGSPALPCFFQEGLPGRSGGAPAPEGASGWACKWTELPRRSTPQRARRRR